MFLLAPCKLHLMIEDPKVIGPEEKFYGYLIGLRIADCESSGDDIPMGLFAKFEIGSVTEEWQVPDWELFSQLTPHLIANARMRDEHGEYGYDKLLIKKEVGEWFVSLP